jgi:hypothetical protein
MRRLLHVLPVLLLPFSSACPHHSSSSPTSGPPDLALAPPGADLAVASPGADLAVAAPGADLGTATPPTPPGLTWPSGQTFPSFGPITTLDVIDVSALPADQQTLFVTLAGLINRTRPRIYTLDNGGEGKTFWLDKLSATKTPISDPFSLLTKYQKEIAGIVIYDDTQPDTINLATTVAGVDNGIVASPALATRLTASPYSLSILRDLRINHFGSKLEIYQYEFDHYASQATRRLICGLSPTVAGNLRDYAVATQALMVWLDPRNSDEKTLLGTILSSLDPLSPYLGWWADEGSGVGAASSAGIPVFAADWASNLTIFGGTPRALAVPPPPPKPALGNNVYIALIMSDGDNLQENEHLIPLKWNDANRGKVPISWTTTPSLVDAAPLILNHYWSSATPNDVLVSGPSGLGYTYPDWWPQMAFFDYAARSARYLDAAGLRAITVWNKDPLNQGNDGKDLSTANAQAYAQNMPKLLGLTLQGGWLRFVHEMTILNGTLPLMRLVQTYGNNETDLETGINNGTAFWSRTSPLFVAVQGNMNSDTINPTTFYNVQQHYASDSAYVFVRLDHFFQLLREANQLPINP